MKDVLLTVSGTIPPNLETEINRGERPLPDYVAMSRAFGADLLDYRAARARTGSFGRFLEKSAGSPAMLAWACFRMRHRYSVIFIDGEHVGIPLAFFSKYFGSGRRPWHLMIAHCLSAAKKRVLFDSLGLHGHIDRFFVYSSFQADFIRRRWSLSEQSVVLTPFMVDTSYYHPHGAGDGIDQAMFEERHRDKPIICSIGRELRDYPTLFKAVEGLPVHVVTTAGSLWSRRADTTKGRKVPDNVTVRWFTLPELRQLYAASRFVVIPLYDVDFQAGVTAILEGMAMGKAVICSRAVGQTDVIVEGETGLYVPPGDPAALRRAVVHLLEHPEEAERMGRNGRRLVEERMSLDRYVQHLNEYVQESKNGAESAAPLR